MSMSDLSRLLVWLQVAQALKSSGVWYRFSGNETMKALSLERMANLDALYGLPTGTYSGEHGTCHR